jgi:hypothetical protein
MGESGVGSCRDELDYIARVTEPDRRNFVELTVHHLSLYADLVYVEFQSKRMKSFLAIQERENAGNGGE